MLVAAMLPPGKTLFHYDPSKGRLVNHVTLVTEDLERAISFYRDGLGLAVLSDTLFEGTNPDLWGVHGARRRMVWLGDPARPDVACVDLIEFQGVRDVVTPHLRTGPDRFLLAFLVDVDATVERLRAVGFAGDLRVRHHVGVNVAYVHDPDGVLIELLDAQLGPDP